MPSENMRALETLILGNRGWSSSGKYEGLERRQKTPPLLYKGGTEGHCLYFANDAAVQRAFLPAGTKFDEHSHGSTEVIIVLSGVFHSTTAFITAVTPIAGVIVFQPGIKHSHFAETNCWVIGVLIPSEPGYPDNRGADGD